MRISDVTYFLNYSSQSTEYYFKNMFQGFELKLKHNIQL